MHDPVLKKEEIPDQTASSCGLVSSAWTHGHVLHDLLLQRTRGLDVHGGGAGLVGVLDVGETEGTATVHVLLELGCGIARLEFTLR